MTDTEAHNDALRKAANSRIDPMTDRITQLERQLAEARAEVANLYCASGCSCCRNDDAWFAASEALGELFDVPKFADGSGRDWWSVRNAARAAIQGEPI